LPFVIAVDASTDHIGIAAGRVGVELVREVTCLKERTLRRTTTERLWPTLDEVAAAGGHDVHLWVEEPPPTFHDDDTGRAKRQATIGTRLGLAMGVTLAWAHARGVEGDLLPNTEWRRWTKTQMASRRFQTSPTASGTPTPAIVTARPPRTREGGGWCVTFEGCDHAWMADDFLQLARRPSTCPECSKPSASTSRNAHKAPFVASAVERWPVVRDFALARRSDAREIHDVPGVADVCDAAWMCAYLLSRG
jgi:hypothetical protein